MRVLLLTAYFPPDVGSAAHLYHELGVALRGIGHEVTVLTTLPGYHALGDLSRYRRRLWAREEVDGLRVVRVATPRLPRGSLVGRAIWQSGAATGMLLAGLALPRQDAAIVYSPPLPLGLAALALKRLRGTRLVLNVQDLFPQSVIDLGLLRGPRLVRFFEGMERLLYTQADMVTVHSEGNAAHVVSRGGSPQHVMVMPNWVNTEHIRPSGDGAEFRRRHGLDGAFVVSFAGVLAHSQDLDVVLEAARILRGQRDIQWLIIGDGVQKERLVREAKEKGLDNVRFLPMLPREEYPASLYASDACLATLKASVRTPVVPSKILSIMAAGRPVIAAMGLDGDAPKLVREAGCGLVLPPEDPEALAGAVRTLYTNALLRGRLGANGRAYAEAHLSLRRAAERYNTVLERLAGDARAAVQRASLHGGQRT